MYKFGIMLSLGLAILLWPQASDALSGPVNGGYLWLVQPQEVGGEWVSPVLKVLRVNPGYTAVAESLRIFSPEIPDNYVAAGQHSYGPGEKVGIPVVYESSDTDGYGSLLIGTYSDDGVPAGTHPDGKTMDVLRLEPQSDGTLVLTKVHNGKAYETGEFHTEDGTQVLYDRDGLFTGTPDSLIVGGESGCMANRSDGYAIDVDEDGIFDGLADTNVYADLDNLPQKKVLYRDFLYGSTQWTGHYGGFDYGAADGLFQTRKSGSGVYAGTLFYVDNDTGVGGPLDLQPSSDQTASNARFAIGDTDEDGVNDIYVSLESLQFDHDDNDATPAKVTFGIGRLRDLNDDGDALDPGEASVFWISGRQNVIPAPFDPDNFIWLTNGVPEPLAVVTDDTGRSVLVCTANGYWRVGKTYFALGMADNGDFNGEASVIATACGGASDPWPHFGDNISSMVAIWETIQDANAPVPGDANGDGKVDGGDLAIWQQNYDPLGTGNNTFATGDWNADNTIDGGDLALWQQNYDPLGPSDGAAFAFGGGTEIPEPTTLLLLVLGVLPATLVRRRGRKGTGKARRRT